MKPRNSTPLLLLLSLVLGACHDPFHHEAPFDFSYDIRGVVLDARTGQPVLGASVGRKIANRPDSLCFSQDTLTATWRSGADPSDTTVSSGGFRLVFWDSYRNTAWYPYLFAYKTGYKLWRYDQRPIPVTAVNEQVDSVQIRLDPL